MAKRRRLTPPRPDYFDGPAPETKALALPGVAPPPISRVAGDASAVAALREVAQELTSARDEGRLLLRLALDQVDDTWLMRDRLGSNPEALDSLLTSLRSHGQRNPIEVAELAPGHYGLISGWRRLMALRQLQAESGEAGTVLALLRRPESAEAAYVAMVEENEIRLGLSYFERARIAAKAVEAGVFASEKIALQRLFAAASRARRSKIGSFLSIYHGLQADLRFATALPERLGLTLARALDTDPGTGPRLAALLRAAEPASAEAEQAVLAAGLARKVPADLPPPETAPEADEIRPGVFLRTDPRGRVVLTGLTPDLLNQLRHWLRDA